MAVDVGKVDGRAEAEFDPWWEVGAEQVIELLAEVDLALGPLGKLADEAVRAGSGCGSLDPR